MISVLIVVAALLVGLAYLGVVALERRDERRRRQQQMAADRFRLRVAHELAKGARVRPKADGRIQRRRYGG